MQMAFFKAFVLFEGILMALIAGGYTQYNFLGIPNNTFLGEAERKQFVQNIARNVFCLDYTKEEERNHLQSLQWCRTSFGETEIALKTLACFLLCST